MVTPEPAVKQELLFNKPISNFDVEVKLLGSVWKKELPKYVLLVHYWIQTLSDMIGTEFQIIVFWFPQKDKFFN